MISSPSSVIPVLKIEGPPGSGKTRELAREACRLIVQDGAPAARMFMLSATPFGRKRLLSEFSAEAKLAGYEGRAPQVHTLHQWLLEILKEFSPPASADGVERPVMLLKDSEAQVLLHEILRQAIPSGHPLYYATRQQSAGRVFMGIIQQVQLQGASAQEVQATVKASGIDDPPLALVAELYERFEERTQAGNLVCYGQLAHRALALLEGNSQALAAVKERTAVILADEAQALPSAVYRVFALLGSRLVLAGNEKLSIRSFRGADPEQFVSLKAYREALNGAVSAQVTYLPKQASWRGNDAVLSLLNEFLPQPIWEAQAIDREQLAETVKFGYFTDPQQEAERVAAHIARFVRQAQVPSAVGSDETDGQRAARWSDCVVLLRSGHYQRHLLQAFQQAGIPYRWEALSEEAIYLQHGIYDLFKVFLEWQKLQINPEQLQAPDALWERWSSGFSSAQEQADWTTENNRHLMRALETLLLTDSQISALRHLPAFTQALPGETSWLLPELANAQAVPPDLARVADDLLPLYRSLCDENSALSLLAGLLERLDERWQTQPGFTAVLPVLQAFQKNLGCLDGYYWTAFSQPLPLKVALENYAALWKGSEESASPQAASTGQDTVRIFGLHQVQGEEFPLVMIPFLVNGEFPFTRELPEILPSEAQVVLGVAAGYQIEEAEEARLLAVGMSRATQQVVLSSHAEDTSELVLPSSFYTALLSSRHRLLSLPEPAWLCRCSVERPRDIEQCHVDFCQASAVAVFPAEQVSDQGETPITDLDRYTGSSLWAGLPAQAPEPLFEPQEVLNISASSIKTYMQCPRQFYYKHLLKLPQPGSDAAALGSLIHRVMEAFNRKAGQMPYTPDSLQHLAESLFLYDSDAEAFAAAGFEERDRQQLSRLSPLGLSQLRQRLLTSIDDLVDKGYFDRYGSLRKVYPEKALENIALPGLERVRFRGAMDAVIELADGSVEILDYKTFRSAYGTGLDTCDKAFSETLEPLPDGDDVSHGDRFAGKLRPGYPTDYQLPLYYMACRQNPEFADRLKAVALQVIRPTFPENPYQGSIRLSISGEQIEASQTQILADIKRYIVSPILESDIFVPNPSQSTCSNCAYFGICETGDDAESEESA